MAQKRMLICIDGSDIADTAFKYAIDQLYKPGDHIMLLKVQEYDVSLSALTGDWEKVCKQFKKSKEQDDEVCDKYITTLRRNDIEGERIISHGGKPGEVICNEARKCAVNHIVMGSRGLSKLQRAFIGSVSNYVLNHAEMPVTIVPKQHK